jgi:hypothetical protein
METKTEAETNRTETEPEQEQKQKQNQERNRTEQLWRSFILLPEGCKLGSEEMGRVAHRNEALVVLNICDMYSLMAGFSNII